jgi:hypothetical protein
MTRSPAPATARVPAMSVPTIAASRRVFCNAAYTDDRAMGD